MAEKYRYAECILYPENMIDDWESVIDDKLQLPFAYCLHDKDKEKDGSEVKPHIHIILVHNNTVALSFFKKWVNSRLSKPDCICCSTCEPILNMDKSVKYLIHDTDKAREEGKFQYPESARRFGNNFDLHHYLQIDENEKLYITQVIAQHILDYNIMDLTSVHQWILSQGDKYYSVFVSRSAYFDRLASGNWKKWERKKNEK